MNIHDLAQRQAKHLKEAIPMLVDLPDETLVTAILAETFKQVFGELANTLEGVHADSQEVHRVEAPAPIPAQSAFGSQVGGNHYAMPIQHAEFCQKNGLPWCESAAIKYLVRHKRKNGLQDVRKAIHYIELMAEMEYNVTPAQLHQKPDQKA